MVRSPSIVETPNASPLAKLPVAVHPCELLDHAEVEMRVTTRSSVRKSLPTRACARSLTASLLWLFMLTPAPRRLSL